MFYTSAGIYSRQCYQELRMKHSPEYTRCVAQRRCPIGIVRTHFMRHCSGISNYSSPFFKNPPCPDTPPPALYCQDTARSCHGFLFTGHLRPSRLGGFGVRIDYDDSRFSPTPRVWGSRAVIRLQEYVACKAGRRARRAGGRTLRPAAQI